MTTHATGAFTYAGWDEHPAGEVEGAARLAHARVTNRFTGAIEAAGTSCEYTIVYTGGTTGVFAGYEQIDGALDGRKGSFVLTQRGHFDEEGTVHCAFEVLAGASGGELTGLTGQGAFTARRGEQEIAYTLDYDLG
ncbi:DUF3224 domain-containing protein [Streptomyces varsoviensis]|uniref:DUF3224 domain-containing protein n=1 Tax=Streptomyces varsoviensis TaxID=67373 RepID=A0ABR5J7G7_9ACTN|nr:DUF3224 domain-containing protein [Streptomyces varsoviensis]KOG89354.1 hypothetical protein ADK38_14740 [Streptomyces varsoviensis]